MEAQSRRARGRVGRYVLYERLGSGGMAEVHRARSYAAEGVVKELCIKRIRAERLTRPGATERFVAEASVSMRLAHGNIVPVFDFGRAGGEYYLAMEHVDGADLCAILTDARERGELLSPVVAAHVAAEVARALTYAHELPGAGGSAVVHGDVKPANVLVSRAGDVKLTDFGVATAVVEPGAGGTPAYMAPEQQRGDAVESRTDLYALGVLLAEMLTGLRAADALAHLADVEDEELRELTGALVEAELTARPDTAREVAERLEQWVGRARGVGAPPPRDDLAERASRCSVARSEAEALELGPDASVARDGLTNRFARQMNATTVTRDRPPTSRSGPPPARPLPPVAWVTGVVLLAGAVGLALSVGAAPTPGPAAPDEAQARATGPQPAASDPVADPAEPGLDQAAVAEEVAGQDRDHGGTLSLQPGGSAGAAGAETGASVQPTADPGPVPAQTTRARSRDPQAPAAHGAISRRTPPVHGAPDRHLVEPATVNINVRPWAYVSVDGHEPRSTPLYGVELAPGEHVLRANHPDLGIERVMRFTVAAGERRNIVLDLQ